MRRVMWARSLSFPQLLTLAGELSSGVHEGAAEKMASVFLYHRGSAVHRSVDPLSPSGESAKFRQSGCFSEYVQIRVARGT